MKKILLGLSLFFILGCSDKTDENGFYIEGKNIGINKETKTEYDIHGFNKDGFDKENFGRDGWSKNKNINKDTKTEYDKNGFDYYGFNKDKINRDTGTSYNIEGFNKEGFNEKGINKITGFSFDNEGFTQERYFYQIEAFAEKILLNPQISSLSSFSNRKDYFMTKDDKFEGITYIGRSYGSDLNNLAIMTMTAETSMDLAKITKKSVDYQRANESINEILEMIKGKLYIDIITNYSPDDKVKSYFTFTFFSPEKQYNLKLTEILIDKNMIKIENSLFNSTNFEMDYSFKVEKLPLYFNQVKIPLTDDLFNLFAQMEKNKKIEVRILTNEDNRFVWINKNEKDKGLAIGLGRHYKMLYPSEYLKNAERTSRIF